MLDLDLGVGEVMVTVRVRVWVRVTIRVKSMYRFRRSSITSSKRAQFTRPLFQSCCDRDSFERKHSLSFDTSVPQGINVHKFRTEKTAMYLKRA